MPSKITVSVAGRVAPPVAKKLADSARQIGVTLSKQVELVLATWTYQESEIDKIDKAWKKAASEMIYKFSDGDASRQRAMQEFLIKKLEN